MVKILEDLGFTTGSARAALGRLVNRHLLARARAGRQVFYSLTPRAEALLSEGDRRIFGFGRSSGTSTTWTMLWHVIPEDQRVSRSRLASRLRFLGFGVAQDGVWIAARDHEEEVWQLVEELDITSYVSMVIGRMSGNIPTPALIAQAWRLTEARQRYELFLADFASPTGGKTQRPSLPVDAFRTRTLMLHRFRGFPSVDPELPESIDVLRDLRRKAVARFDEIYAALEEQATMYFWESVRVPEP